MMAKKHFEEIAKILGTSVHGIIDISTMEEVIDKFCIFFKQENPKFNEDKFRERISEYANSERDY